MGKVLEGILIGSFFNGSTNNSAKLKRFMFAHIALSPIFLATYRQKNFRNFIYKVAWIKQGVKLFETIQKICRKTWRDKQKGLPGSTRGMLICITK